MSLRYDPAILNSPHLPNLPSNDEIKQAHNLDKVTRLSFNESPLGASPLVVAKIQEMAGTLDIYPDFTDKYLRQKLAQTLGRALTPDHFYCGGSGGEALELAFRAFIQPNDEVIVCHPTFTVYDRLTQLHGGKIVNVPLLGEDFAVDVEAILAAINEKTQMVLLCNPNNPTGTIMPAAAMTKLIQNLPDHLLLVSDEVYFHYSADPNFPDMVQYMLEGANVIIIHTFSKAYGLAGLRLGYGITTLEIADYIRRLYRGFHLSTLALNAGIIALQDQAHLQRNIDVVNAGKTYLYQQFDHLDLPYTPSQANFIMVHLPRPAAPVADALQRQGVLVNSLARAGLANTLRVTVGMPAANETFIHALKTILQMNIQNP